ncbi:hypothetical protein A2U01_0023065 [Trifolium medium]|uniref:Uncharacterized protein n=1 Tax=Trifolium medium TaxID=97028 RepID=A0A392NQG1_9FABA|nr:hypothetical protein [Trifolium medium]
MTVVGGTSIKIVVCFASECSASEVQALPKYTYLGLPCPDLNVGLPCPNLCSGLPLLKYHVQETSSNLT